MRRTGATGPRSGLAAASVALAVAIVAVSLLVSPNFRWTDGERGPYGGDFLHEWTGAHIVRSGDTRRLYESRHAYAIQHDPALVGFRLRRDGFLPLVYPPIYYLALSPLAAWPYPTAAWVWAGITIAAFAATAVLLFVSVTPLGTLDRVLPAPDARGRAVRRLAAIVALPAAVAFTPFAENLVGGQKATLLLLVTTATWLALQQGRPLVAGLVFGLLAVKPQLALVIPIALLAKGCWPFALGAATTASVLIAGSVAMGADVARSYLDLVQAIPEQIRLAPGQPHRIHGAYGFFTILGGAPTWPVRAAAIATTAFGIWLVARLLRGPLDTRSPRFPAQYAGLVVATVVLAPNVVTYDLTILLLPLFLLGSLLFRGSVQPARRRPLLWALAGTYVACCVSPSIARHASIQVTLPVLLALLALLGRQDLLATPSLPERAPLPDAEWLDRDVRPDAALPAG